MRQALLLCLLSLPACASAPPPPSVETVGQAGLFPNVTGIGGEPHYLGDLLQDRILSAVRDGRPGESIDRVDWLLLVTSKPGCEWTRRFLEELVPVLPDLRSMNVRAAVVLDSPPGEHAEAWERIRSSGIPVFLDPSGACYRFYVQTGTPALSLAERWGTVVFTLDGYLPPADLVAKIRAGDFASVAAAGG